MIKIISRKSDLAVIQAEIVANELKNIDKNIKISFIKKETEGDIDQLTSLSNLSNIGVFTNDIREALLKNEADIAVHSLKDLPIEQQEDTSIISILERADSRDMLFLKKYSFDEYNDVELKILTSSPRRVHNFSKFLNLLLPFKSKKISFEDVRGNVPTRLNKLLNGNSHGLIVAKAAIDRLIYYGEDNTSKEIRSIIDNFLWMVVPLSLNPCAPGQGAIAVEVNSNRKDIIDLVSKINHSETNSAVKREREILQNYGGGCHQKIGVSIENKNFGKILTLKGQTEEGLVLKRREIENNEISPWKNIEIENFFPSNLTNYNLFDRKIIDKNINKINKLKNTNIYISRENTLQKDKHIHSSNVLWTSGVKTWEKLADKGYWVNGTSDSLGEEDPKISCLTSNKKWVKLTHNRTSKNYFKLNKTPNSAKIISTYELNPIPIIEDLDKKSHFYWMSGSAFRLALKSFPNIINAQHACGPGNTLKTLKKYVKENNINVFLSYDDALKVIKDSGEIDENL